jgi:hypothetical protein
MDLALPGTMISLMLLGATDCFFYLLWGLGDMNFYLGSSVFMIL